MLFFANYVIIIKSGKSKTYSLCRYDGMADVTDSKSVGSNTVRVQVPLPAPNSRNPNPKPVGEGFGFLFVFGDM